MSNPRVGVIGVGAMGQNHARVVAELPGVELAGVADASAETARSVADRFGVAAYSDYESLLDAGVDAVVKPQPSTFGLAGWHFQPFLPPDPLYPLVVHRPTIGS